ncbi:MAG: UDP-N-acetylmuramoyl-L-alanine--D-glutamate ligase [Verrucomicrobiota bacterium]|nr:UDP-N-acetylmuramoyl-L-alanine--D-glutamate ligase [Verrucomicrobiota bacterium]
MSILTDTLRGKPIAILGNGVTGKGVAKLLDSLNSNYRIFDQKGNSFEKANPHSFSLVVYSPGFTNSHPWLNLARSAGIPILSELDFASQFTSSPIVAVTGTNGKSSMVTLLCHLWKKVGRKSIAAGNIGVSLSEVIAEGLDDDSTIFLEVSSFQSGTMRKLNPEFSFWVNFAEDHLDVHDSKEDYFVAKKNLLTRTRKKIWVGSSVLEAALDFRIELPGDVKVVSPLKVVDSPYDSKHFLSSYPQLENLALVIEFAKLHGFDRTEVLEAFRDYSSLDHRLQEVLTVDHATYWNDSKATNFLSVLAACKTLDGNIIWIGGGKSKGLDLQDFSNHISKYVDQAFLFGEVAEELSVALKRKGLRHSICSTITEAVKKSHESTNLPANVLFSPGFASFDTHSNYASRGKSFFESVFDLKNAPRRSTEESLT